MCGIVGYIGAVPPWEVILEGLRRLEYRGYDSAGIATVYDGALHELKSVEVRLRFQGCGAVVDFHGEIDY